MQDKKTPALSDALIWRLAQIVLVLAAMYLYFTVRSFGGLLQRDRLFGNPHTGGLVQAIIVGLALGLCIGLALKDLSQGVVLAIDWPTIVINLLAAGLFVAVAIGLNLEALRNVTVLQGAIKDAVVLSPLLPFVWVGLTLTTVVQGKR
jgi:hypothetical protein